MHSDHRLSDVEPARCRHPFDDDGVLHLPIRIRRKRTAGMEPRHDTDFLQTESLRIDSFHDKRPIQMFAALKGQGNLVLFCDGQKCFHDGRAHFVRAVLSNRAADDFTRRRPDDEQSAARKFRDGNQFFQSRPRLFRPLFNHGGHSLRWPQSFRDAAHGDRPRKASLKIRPKSFPQVPLPRRARRDRGHSRHCARG